jgi:hypothetical protein
VSTACRGVGVLLAFLAAFIASPAALRAADAAPQLRTGFNGFVKPGRWFPVQITNAPVPSSYEMFVMSEGWCGSRPTPVFHAAGTITTPVATALCMLGDSSENHFIQCSFQAPPGRLITAQCPVKPLSQNDLLVLVVSEIPHSFDFLGGIQLPDRGVVCAVPTGAESFPALWRELDCVDIVILDQPPSAMREESLKCLQDWTVAGGTVILTAGACTDAGEAGRRWPLPRPAAGPVAADGLKMLAPLFGEYEKHLISIPFQAYDVPPVERILGDRNGAVLAAADVGAGRVVALGFDWRQMELRDRMFIEGARHAIWSSLISLSRPAEEKSLSRDLVTPDEAKAKFLTRYIAVFLALYVLILGPVNWLVLRKMKKLEYGIVTLPAGAVLFAVIAFALGLALRSDRTILREAEVVLVHNSDRGLLMGTAGVMAPDRNPYTLSLADAGSVIVPDRQGSWGPETTRLKDMPVYDTSSGFSLANAKIGMWSIRYFSVRGIVPLGGSMAGALSLGAGGISGTLTNSTAVTIRDAVLFHRWNRVLLGTMEPGSSRAVSLPLSPASRKIFGKCSNCGRFHGSDGSLSEKYCRDNPLPGGMREFAAEMELNGKAPMPLLAGWVDSPGASIDTGRADCSASRKRLCVFILPISAEGPEMAVPEGFVGGRSGGEPGKRRARFVHDIRSATIAAGGSKDANPSWMQPDSCYGDMIYERAAGRFGRDRTPDTREYLLPFRLSDIETTRLDIHWDVGERDEEEGVCTQVMAAFDWNARAWVDIAKAWTNVDQVVSAQSPDRFVSKPDCIVALRTLNDTNRLASLGANFVEIGWAGRRGSK